MHLITSHFSVFLVLLIIEIFGFSQAASVAGLGPELQALGDGYLVQLAGEWEPAQAIVYFEGQGLHVLDTIPQIGVWHVQSRAMGDTDVLANLQAQPAVAWAEINGTMRIAEVMPNDNFYQAQQENLRVIRLPDAWEVTTGDDTIIAMVDTGIDLSHPDLATKIWSNPGEVPANSLDDDANGFVDDLQGWDFVHADSLPDDDQGHGSHVSGIAAAGTNNHTGIAGVSWGARLMPLKALDQNGGGSWDDISQAIIYAADNEARVINLSIGGDEYSQTIVDAIEYARSRGSLVVAAAGNGGGAVMFPARMANVLAVAATDNQDIPWNLSNRGPEIDVAAPGVEIFSTNGAGSYTDLSGTSMSTAHVSGLAALLWSLDSDLVAGEIAEAITVTAVDVWSPGFDHLTGWGRIDASAAASLLGHHSAYFPSILVTQPESSYYCYLPMMNNNPARP